MLGRAEDYKNIIIHLDFTKFDIKNSQKNPIFKELFKNNFIIVDSNWLPQYNYSPYTQEKDYEYVIRHAKKKSDIINYFSEEDGYLI